MARNKPRIRLPGGFQIPPFGIHQFLALMIVCIALWSLAVLWLGIQAGSQWVGSWQQEIRIHVYLDRSKRGQSDALLQELSKIPGIEQVRRISPAEATRWMQEWLGNTGLQAREIEHRLPETFELFLGPKVHDFLFADIRDAAGRFQAKINEDEIGLAKAHRWLGKIRLMLLFATLIMGIAMALIISNTLRMILLARAEEIHLMRLMGAKEWFVRMPFMLEGIVLGGGAGGLAWLLLWPLVLLTDEWMSNLSIDLHIGILLPALIAGGALTGFLGALVATMRVVSPDSPD